MLRMRSGLRIRWRVLAMMMCVGLLAGGCGAPRGTPDTYCLVADPLWMEPATPDWLAAHDPALLRMLVVHNMTHDRLCPA